MYFHDHSLCIFILTFGPGPFGRREGAANICPSVKRTYLPGRIPCRRKAADPHESREGPNRGAVKADECTTKLQDRVNQKLRVRKQQFVTIKTLLRKAFYWSPDARRGLAQYLRSKGWTVIECATEADLKIASDCKAGDIVISSDSDMLLYKNVTTIWRPISRQRFLVYRIPDILATLGVSRTQFTVLGLVSHNDYNRNIYGLGCSTNFSIIKELHGAGKFSYCTL
jgi:hypothetical protein